MMKSSLVLILSILVKTSTECKYDGKNYTDGERWVQKEAFVMECRMFSDTNSWMVHVVGCKTPTDLMVPINSSIIDGDDEWTCTLGNDGRVVMQQGVNPYAKCGEHNHGEQWRDKSFFYECSRGGKQKLVACIGEGDERISVGEAKEINGYLVKCEQYENGTVIIHGTRQIPQTPDGTMFELECIDSKGKHHAARSWWIDNHRFNKTCLPSGKIEVVNCISKNGLKIPVNLEVTHGDTKFLCEKTKDGAIRFASGPADVPTSE